MYKYLIVNLDFSTSVFRGGISFWVRLFLIIVYLYLFVRLLIYFCIAHMILLHINNSLPRDRTDNENDIYFRVAPAQQC